MLTNRERPVYILWWLGLPVTINSHKMTYWSLQLSHLWFLVCVWLVAYASGTLVETDRQRDLQGIPLVASYYYNQAKYGS